MLFHRLDGHFLPVEDTCSQGGLHVGLFKDLGEVFHISGSTGGNHRYSDVVTDVVDQLDIKAAVGTVLINAVKEYFPGTQLLTGLCQL